MIIDTIFQSILYIPLILGIFLSFKLLRLTDLTADGSFVMGAGLYARLSIEGIPYYGCIFMGIFGGFCVGFALAYIQKNNRVPSIVASIICVFMLYSINMLVMGCPNISLLTHSTPLSDLMDSSPFLFNALLLGTVNLITLIFLGVVKSKIGLILRAFGINYDLTNHHGYRPELIRSLGLGISNAFYATSGILCVQVQKFADINMGVGIALIGIGFVIIGAQLFIRIGLIAPERFKSHREIIASIVGIFLYFLFMNILLSLSLNPLYLKLFLGILLVLTFTSKIKGVSYANSH
jgi:putative tryptophan/tyrosine transport system permease protein